MTTTFTHRNLPRLLLQARESVMAHTRPGLRDHGLSDQQWRVLRVLGEHGTVETGRVAREAFILGPSLTGMLARISRRIARPNFPQSGPADVPNGDLSGPYQWLLAQGQPPAALEGQQHVQDPSRSHLFESRSRT